MITNNRVFENKFLFNKSNNYLNKLPHIYPFLRQLLFLYFKNSNYKYVALPHYCPEGIYDPFLKNNFVIYFYDVDEEGYIKDNAFLNKVDIFVYIHYFGLYNFDNINKIINNKDKYNILLEDFAHTIYTDDLKLTGDICTFSFTKMIGVLEGSFMLIKKDSDRVKMSHTKPSIKSNLIKLDIFLEMFFNSFTGFYMIAKIFRKIKSLLEFNYYTILMDTYSITQPEIGYYSKNIIDKIDFNAVATQRMRYAKIYLEKLNQNLLFNVPKDFYLQQSLFAFPIKVKSRDDFLKIMNSKSVCAFSLSSRWCFGNISDKNFYDKHVLLPINHNLSEDSINEVIKKANSTYEQINHEQC